MCTPKLSCTRCSPLITDHSLFRTHYPRAPASCGTLSWRHIPLVGSGLRLLFFSRRSLGISNFLGIQCFSSLTTKVRDRVSSECLHPCQVGYCKVTRLQSLAETMGEFKGSQLMGASQMPMLPQRQSWVLGLQRPEELCG